MFETLEEIEGLTDVGAVLLVASEYLSRLGAERQSYHISPVFDAANSDRTTVFAAGFSDTWMALYNEQGYRFRDPIPERTMRHGARLSWKDAIELEENTPEQEEYFEAMRDHGLVHGFGLPLFGAGGREAYASFDFGRPLEEVSHSDMAKLTAVAQAAQGRISKLLNSARDYPVLSDRETEVLRWLARGKSVTEIATILDLSPETIRTYSKRLHDKLGAHNRVGAIIKALKLNLLRL
ncbi:MAG: LuxR family transcriptional regulator [Erythrobacter sp.]